MPKRFPLSVLTPERTFFNGEAVSITVETIDGQIGVLADHVPMVTALTMGTLVIRQENQILVAFHSEGFMEVTARGAEIFCQVCEWPDEIDIDRAAEAQRRAEERLSHASDTSTMAHSAAALKRAIKRIKVKTSINN
jgi:F-type H+-transporting ATPase subunit epsilon